VSYGCCVSLLLVSKLGAALVEFVQWEFRNSPTRHLLDLRDLLLIDCTILLRSYPSVDDEHSMLSYSVSSYAMELRPID